MTNENTEAVQQQTYYVSQSGKCSQVYKVHQSNYQMSVMLSVSPPHKIYTYNCGFTYFINLGKQKILLSIFLF